MKGNNPKQRTKATKRHRPERQPRSRAPRTTAGYHALPDKSKDTLDRVLKVIARMRSEKVSLKRAALEAGTKPDTVKRWAGSALEKRNGRFAPKKSDRLLRVLRVPTPDGMRDIAVVGFRQASMLGEYWAAVQKYLETGNAVLLQRFQGKFIKDADGNEIPLLTDRAELNRIGSAGVLSFESLYSRVA